MHSSNTTFIVLLTFFSISLGQTTPGLMTFNATNIDPYTQEITITFIIPKKDFIYKDFIICSVDNPLVSLSPWKANKQFIAHYDASFKEAKQVFNEDFTITMTAIRQKPFPNPLHLHCSYYRRSEKKINHVLFPLIFAEPEQAAQEIIDATDNIAINNKPIKKRKTTFTIIDDYIFSALYITHSVCTSLHTDHKKYCALLMFLIMVLCSFLSFFKKELQNQIKIKELIEIIISLLVMAIIAYIILSIHELSTPLITMTIACVWTLCAGFFYIKKSTNLQSARLRTFCTFIGMLCMCSTIFLSFKVLQLTDDQFNLL